MLRGLTQILDLGCVKVERQGVRRLTQRNLVVKASHIWSTNEGVARSDVSIGLALRVCTTRDEVARRNGLCE